MILAVRAVNHAFSPAQIRELDLTTVTILKMWPFTVMAHISLRMLTAALLAPILTAVLIAPVSLVQYIQSPPHPLT